MHTLPEDHSASEVSKENTLGNVSKLTQHYPASDVGTIGNASSELGGNVC